MLQSIFVHKRDSEGSRGGISEGTPGGCYRVSVLIGLVQPVYQVASYIFTPGTETVSATFSNSPVANSPHPAASLAACISVPTLSGW